MNAKTRGILIQIVGFHLYYTNHGEFSIMKDLKHYTFTPLCIRHPIPR